MSISPTLSKIFDRIVLQKRQILLKITYVLSKAIWILLHLRNDIKKAIKSGEKN